MAQSTRALPHCERGHTAQNGAVEAGRRGTKKLRPLWCAWGAMLGGNARANAALLGIIVDWRCPRCLVLWLVKRILSAMADGICVASV